MGVIGYEFMLGKVKISGNLQRPYNGKTRKDIRDAIFAKQVSIKLHEMPEGWSPEAADFINKVKYIFNCQLLQRKAVNRLGNCGPLEVKNHEWFSGFNWDALLKK